MIFSIAAKGASSFSSFCVYGNLLHIVQRRLQRFVMFNVIDSGICRVKYLPFPRCSSAVGFSFFVPSA